jgi:uncharacterized protein (TIGR03067 family)
MTATALVLVAGLLTAAADDKQEATKKDRELMQGHWTVVSLVRNGMDVPQAQGIKVSIDADGNAAHLPSEKEPMPDLKGKITIDPSKNPKTIDLVVVEGSRKGQTMAGIYEIDGDTLRICRPGPGKDRPTEFSSKEGSGCDIITYKRDKP